MVHRDIKPENIMIGRQQRSQLMDFGLAKPLSDDSQTVDGTVFGTPAYMSPEQARGEVRDAGFLSDQRWLDGESVRARPLSSVQRFGR